MNTIHSTPTTSASSTWPHKDPRRARAAGQNIIPTTTGAAKALALVIPELKGKFDGFSLRVPTPTVSVVDFTADRRRATTSVEELNDGVPRRRGRPDEGHPGRHRRAARVDRLQGRQPLVDHRRATRPMVLGGTMVKVIAWYDNEWGYSCRVADLVASSRRGCRSAGLTAASRPDRTAIRR